jgi:hypothetical protein
MLMLTPLLLIVIVVLLSLIFLAIQSEARVSGNTATHIWEYKVAPIGTREGTSDSRIHASCHGWELPGRKGQVYC